MSIINSHYKLKLKLLSQAVKSSKRSSLNYTKYSSSLNEVCETAPSLSFIYSKSNKCNKIKSKFLNSQLNQIAPNAFQKNNNKQRFKNNLNTISKNKRNITTIKEIISKRVTNNCLNIMRQGLTKQNMHNSLLMIIVNINKKSNPKKQKDKFLIPQTIKINKTSPKIENIRTSNSIFAEYLTHDLKYKFDVPFSLVSSQRFKPENRLIHDLEMQNYDEINALAIRKTLKDNFEIKGKVCNTAYEIHYQERKKTNRLIIDKFIRVLIKAAIDFQHFHISLDEFYSNKFIITTPFQNEDSKQLIQNVKEGKIKKTIQMILNNKYLVRDFDYFNLTALHWAAKRNRYKVISQMVSVGANVNAQDCIRRTPLHYAIIYNHIESVLVLLYEMAFPTMKDNSGKNPIDYALDFKSNYILHRAETLHILHDKGKQKNWKKNIQTGLLYCFIDDLKLSFDLSKFRIIV